MASIRKNNFSEHTANSIHQLHNESVAFLDGLLLLLLFFFYRPCGKFLGFRGHPRVCWTNMHLNLYNKYIYCIIYRQLCAKFYLIISLHNDGFSQIHTFWVPPSPADPSESDEWSMQAWWSLDPERLAAPPHCCHGGKIDIKKYLPGNDRISHFTKTCNHAQPKRH